MSVNKAILVGRLGADPEVRWTPQGTAVCNFNLATSNTYKDKEGQRQTQTEWHRIVAWNQTAELAGKYLSKGREVYIEGELRTRSYDDKDGNKRYTTEVHVRDMRFIGGGGGGEGQQKSSQTADMDVGQLEGDADVPF